MNYKIIITLIALSSIIILSIANRSLQKPTHQEKIIITPSLTPTLSPSPSQTPTSLPQNINEAAVGVSIDDLIRVGPDTDGDGLKNIIDNCPFLANPDQRDDDQSGVGDDCEVIEMAKEDLAYRLAGHRNPSVLGIGEEKITEMTWSNSCLGLETPEEVCAAVITPGYQVILEVKEKKYIYHTDKFKIFRFAGEQK